MSLEVKKKKEGVYEEKVGEKMNAEQNPNG